MKKIIIIAILPIIAILFWSPWMGEDGGEDIIKKVQQEDNVKSELEALVKKGGCDGLSSVWSPFGRTIKYCEYGSWYVTFWGQMIYSTTSSIEEVEEPQNEDPITYKDFPRNGTLFRGYYFDIKYPREFIAKPVEPTVDYNRKTFVQTDEAYFSSPDGTVEFFVYSPLWSGDPENYLTIAPTEEIVSEKSETGPALPNQLRDSERVIRWVTIKAKDESYYRSFISIKEQVREDGHSELHHVFGIKYQDDEVYEEYKDAYDAFKNSLEQYAD